MEQQSNRSLNRILEGTPNHAVLLNTDVGFVEKGSVNLTSKVTTAERCAQLGIPHIYPFRQKDNVILQYQPQPVHRTDFNRSQDEVLVANSARVSTSLRSSIEQFFP